jgi:hypothetical protein
MQYNKIIMKRNNSVMEIIYIIPSKGNDEKVCRQTMVRR